MLRAVRLAAKGGLAIDPKTAAPISEAREPRVERAAGAPVRRDAEAPPVRPRRGDAREPARARPVARPAAAARHDPRAAARHPLHRGRRSRAPMRACAKASRCRPRSCSRRSCGTKCCSSGTPRSRAAKSRCPRCTRRWTACSRRRPQRISIPRRFEATIKEIWALQPRFEQRAGQRPVSPARARALPRGVRLSLAARRIGRSPAGAGRLVDALPGRERTPSAKRC